MKTNIEEDIFRLFIARLDRYFNGNPHEFDKDLIKGSIKSYKDDLSKVDNHSSKKFTQLKIDNL